MGYHESFVVNKILTTDSMKDMSDRPKKIPQKSFDSQLHIIRDVHFDVDKYKIDELYVIKHKITNAHTIDGKMVGKLIKAEADALTFDIFTEVIPEGVLPTDPHNYYRIKTIILSLDEIIEKQIEIERLLTETEAAMYLAGDMLEMSTKKAAGVLLGYGQASHDNFWNDFRNCKSQQEIKAAYKIDEDTAKECVNFGEMAKEIAVRDMAERMNYIVYPKGQQPMSMFENNGTTFDVESFMNLSGIVKITMKKKESAMVIYTDAKNIRVVFDTIEIRNKRGTIHMNFNIANIRSMFDNIIFEDQQ